MDNLFMEEEIRVANNRMKSILIIRAMQDNTVIIFPIRLVKM